MRRREEYARVYKEGKPLRAGSLRARWSASPLLHVRLGIVVPLHGHSAVDRNRVKRRLRDLVRHHLLDLPGGVDIILKASEHSYAKTFDELKSEVESMRASLELRVATP